MGEWVEWYGPHESKFQDRETCIKTLDGSPVTMIVGWMAMCNFSFIKIYKDHKLIHCRYHIDNDGQSMKIADRWARMYSKGLIS